jgi:ribosome-binding ATPase YchF (GTP1/OBG family)
MAKERELDVLKRIAPALEEDRPIRALDLSDEDERQIANFGFLTQKPLLIVANISEDQEPAAVAETLRTAVQAPRTGVLALPAKLEMELGELPSDEAAEFMQAMGVESSHLGEVIRQSYDLASLLSFFTAGDDECRAWTIRRGTNAQDAAGEIHSDLARGFIRAEVIRWDQLLEAGSEAAAKKRGWVRQEGKVYVVQDGDVLHILFNV